MTTRFSGSRRNLLRGAGAATAALGLSSFGLPARAQAATNLVVLATGDTLAYLEYLKAQFEQEFPNVTVELQTVGYDQLYTRIASVMASGSAAVDVVEMDLIWTADFARNGWATPLNDYFSAAELGQMRAGLLDPFQSEGKLLGLPMATVFKTMFYNTEFLAEVGLSAPPATFEELAEIGARIRGSGNNRYVQGLSLINI